MDYLVKVQKGEDWEDIDLYLVRGASRPTDAINRIHGLLNQNDDEHYTSIDCISVMLGAENIGILEIPKKSGREES